LARPAHHARRSDEEIGDTAPYDSINLRDWLGKRFNSMTARSSTTCSSRRRQVLRRTLASRA
jgi:hypothetical protein